MITRIDDKKTKLSDRMMWAMWRDFFRPTYSWHMKTPIGHTAFKTKKTALASKAMYEKVAAREAYLRGEAK